MRNLIDFRRVFQAAIFLGMIFVAAGNVQAKDGEFSQEDLDYAEKLAGQMHFDFAEEICNENMKAAQTKETKAKAQLSLARIKRMQAQKVVDPEIRKQLTEESAGILDDLIKNNPDHPNISDFKFETAEIRIEQGMWFSQKLKNETNPEVRKKLKQDIDNTFGIATKYLKDMLDEYYKKLNDEQDSAKRAKINDTIGNALYLYGTTYYYYGTSYDKGEDKFKTLLQEAVKQLRQFAVEYSDLFTSYEAADYCGLCYMELGNYSSAKSFFESASYKWKKIIDEMEDEEEQARALEATKQTIQKAMAHFAQAANANGEYNLAVQAVDDVTKWFPKDDSYEMQLAQLQKAWAFYKTGNGAAFEIIKKIADSIGPAARDAKNMIDAIIQMPGGNVSPEMLMVSVRSLFGKSRYYEAIKSAQILMNKLKDASEDDRVKYFPEALFYVGESFKWQTPARYYEAIIAYEAIYLNSKFKNVKSGETFYGAMATKAAADCYFLMGVKGGDQADKQKKSELVEMLIKSWPETSEAKESQWNYAKELEMEEKFIEAGDGYANVPSSSKYYIDAKFRCGYMYYLQATKKNYKAYLVEADANNKAALKEETAKYFALAEKKFKEFLKFSDENRDSPTYSDEDKKKIRKNELYSRTFLGRMFIHEFIERSNDAFEIMNDLEKRYKDPEDIATILQVRIESLAKMGKMDDAESLLSDFLRSSKNAQDAATPIYQLMAELYEAKAEKIIPPLAAQERDKYLVQINDLKKQNKEQYDEFYKALTKSSEYYDKWISKTEKASANDAIAVADKLYQSSEKLEKTELYTKAARIYDKVLGGEYGDTTQTPESIKLKLARCYTRTRDWKKALPLLEELDKKETITIKKELAATYTEMGNDTKEARYWNNAKRVLSWITVRVPKHEEEWWNARYQMVVIDVTAGLFKEANDTIASLRATVNKDLDDDKWGYKTKFLALEKKIKEVMPGGGK
ncbi:MAG: hypothetical protein WC980_08990 [Candidatus Brocadiia bacterium]